MPARGNQLPHAKLNPDLVMKIRATIGQKPAKQWAKEIGCHVRSIEKVRANASWFHIR